MLNNQMSEEEFIELLPLEWIKISTVDIIKNEWAKNFITIFIKGDIENPKDDYQQDLIDILREYKFKFGYFNVIQDQLIRKELKDHTGWKSYPQVFLGGKFYGGLTKFIDLLKSGKALTIIPATEILLKPIEKTK